VHGLAMLMIEGPLQGLDDAHVEKLGGAGHRDGGEGGCGTGHNRSVVR
jgi:hypothetical protein